MATGRPETVTVLFSDLVGSTAWRVRVGDAVADERTTELDRASRDIVEAAGGTVVKSVGDGIMATFTSAVIALDVAAALQGVARRLAVGGRATCLRVGLSTGELVREGDDWLGAAAIEAARLCAAADGGTVLVGDLSARLSRGRSAHHLRSLGERVLRGFETPLEVFELVVEAGAPALPAVLARAAETPMFGRQVELDRLRGVLDAVAAGASEALLVVGEPGVGKTRLAAAMAVDAADRGFTVLFGRCDEGVTAPYRPVVEALAPWLADVPGAALDRIVGGGRAALSRLWPDTAAHPTESGGDPESERWRLFDAVTALLRSMVEDGPLLLVIDDLQWAEPSSRLLLAHLARASIPRCVLVSTVRRAEADAELIRLLGETPTLDVGGLAPAAVAELVARHAGADPPAALSSELCRQTDGNPFFLGALLAHLDDVASVRGIDGSWLTAAELEATGVPVGVRAVIDRRLATLGEDAQRTLDVAAVCGSSFEERIVTATTNSSVDHTVVALDEAVAAGLLREEGAGRYVFAHALVRQSVLDALSLTRLARLHWRVGEQLERHARPGSRLGEIAAHYTAAGEAGDAATIVRTSLAAGEDAIVRLAFDEAARHLRTALAVVERGPTDPDTAYRVFSSLGAALNALSDLDAAEPLWVEAARIAEDTGDPVRLFDALLGYSYVNRMAGEEPDLMRRIDIVLELVGPTDSPLRAMALGFKHLQRVRTVGSPPDHAQLDAAVRMARRTGDVDALASTLRSRLAVLSQGPLGKAMLRDAEELATLDPTNRFASGDPATLGRDRGRALLRLGRRADAERHLAATTIEAERSGLRMAVNSALIAEASIAIASGAFGEGKRLAAEARNSANRRLPAVELAQSAQVLAIRMEEGRPGDVISVLRGNVSSRSLLPWRAMLTSALAHAGSNEEAAIEFDRVIEHLTDGFSHMYGAPLAVRHVPEACRLLDDRACAAQMLPHTQEWSGILLVLNTSIECAADRSIGHLLAVLGRYDEADRFYTSAAEMERSAGFPPLLARTEYWHARALLERDAPGDRERAAGLLDEAVEITSRLGMELLCRQASELRLA